MTCDELQDLFELYSLGLAEPEETVEIEAHLARHCATCEPRMKDALARNAMLMSLAPEVKPPARLKRRVMASVGVHKASWTWLPALAAAAMLVVALWLGNQERQRTAELAEARRTILQIGADRDRLAQAVSFLNQADTRQVNFGGGRPAPPRGNVLVNPRLGVLLIAGNLPAINPGQTFEMWVIPKGAAPQPAGLFRAASDGTAVHLLPGMLDTASIAAVAISVEPASGSPAPTTTPIVVAAVNGA